MVLSGLFGASGLALLLAGAPQVTITTPSQLVPGQTQRQGERDYGPPRVVELESIVSSGSNQREHVITMGVLNIFKPGLYWTLRDGGATVLVLAGLGVGTSDLDAMGGRRVEARGIVRALRRKEYLHGVDADLIEDPTLPVLPAPDFEHGFPRISLTILALADRSDRETGKAGLPAGALIKDILARPDEHLGKTVRILGQFRGSNLFGDLPDGSRRDRDDWVLRDGDAALWVTGKAPRGKGFSLDPAYRGDGVRWLEVAGKPEVVGGVLYLRASKVVLAAKRPETAATDP